LFANLFLKNQDSTQNCPLLACGTL